MDEQVARQMAKIRLTGALARIEGSASGARQALGMVREIDWDGLDAVLQDITREMVQIRAQYPQGKEGKG